MRIIIGKTLMKLDNWGLIPKFLGFAATPIYTGDDELIAIAWCFFNDENDEDTDSDGTHG